MVRTMALTGAHAPGATPLETDDIEGLIPPTVATQRDLNEWEEANIASARRWLQRQRKWRNFLEYSFALELHRQMFSKTWRWAGTLRGRETVIGVDPRAISLLLPQALSNAEYQLDRTTDRSEIDEIAARLHHRLVQIHPFRNGNGRHSRLLVDRALTARQVEPFSWGRANLFPAGPLRDTYIASLRAADAGDFEPLYAFVRT
jgi:Fic-DOC domain mobile mystery protein B